MTINTELRIDANDVFSNTKSPMFSRQRVFLSWLCLKYLGFGLGRGRPHAGTREAIASITTFWLARKRTKIFSHVTGAKCT